MGDREDAPEGEHQDSLGFFMPRQLERLQPNCRLPARVLDLVGFTEFRREHEKAYRPLLRAGRGSGGLHSRREMHGQTLALLGIEHSVTLHEGNLAHQLFALVVGLGAGEAVGINDKLATLAFPHMPAELEGLLEGEPEGRGITLGHGYRHSITTLIPL